VPQAWVLVHELVKAVVVYRRDGDILEE